MPVQAVHISVPCTLGLHGPTTGICAFNSSASAAQAQYFFNQCQNLLWVSAPGPIKVQAIKIAGQTATYAKSA